MSQSGPPWGPRTNRLRYDRTLLCAAKLRVGCNSMRVQLKIAIYAALFFMYHMQ